MGKFGMNFFGGIKFGELVELACTPVCLHTLIIQRNIQGYFNLWMKGVKSA